MMPFWSHRRKLETSAGFFDYSAATQERQPLETTFPFHREPQIGHVVLQSTLTRVIGSQTTIGSLTIFADQHFFMPYAAILPGGNGLNGVITTDPNEAFAEQQRHEDGVLSGETLLRQRFRLSTQVVSDGSGPGLNTVMTGWVVVARMPQLELGGGPVGMLNQAAKSDSVFGKVLLVSMGSPSFVSVQTALPVAINANVVETLETNSGSQIGIPFQAPVFPVPPALSQVPSASATWFAATDAPAYPQTDGVWGPQMSPDMGPGWSHQMTVQTQWIHAPY